MSFKELTDKIEGFTPKDQKLNIPDHITDLMYLACGLTGEAGELANLVKKLARGDTLYNISTKIMNAKDDHTLFYDIAPVARWKAIVLAALKEEIAGTFIYLELICRSLEVDLSEVVLEEVGKIAKKREKPFNKGWEEYRNRKMLEGEK